MTDIVERLRDLERVEHELAHDGDCPPEATANWKYAETCREAARTIEILRVELAKVNMENDRLTRTNRAKREHRDKLLAAKAKDAARIERLEAALRPFADESIFSGPQHEYVTVKRSDCDIARAALESPQGCTAKPLEDRT